MPAVAPGTLPVWHLYVVQVDNRDRVQGELKERGVATGLHYPTPLHLQQAYRSLGHARGDFPVAEAYADRLLSLPMFPELREDQVRHVADSLLATVSLKSAAS